MSEEIRENRLINNYVRSNVSITSIMDKMRENSLKMVWACVLKKGIKSNKSSYVR